MLVLVVAVLVDVGGVVGGTVISISAQATERAAQQTAVLGRQNYLSYK